MRYREKSMRTGGPVGSFTGAPGGAGGGQQSAQWGVLLFSLLVAGVVCGIWVFLRVPVDGSANLTPVGADLTVNIPPAAGAGRHSLNFTQTTLRRRRAAILGAFVADAASMGLHWIYDPAKIESILIKRFGNGGVKSLSSLDPAFYSPTACPFYHDPPYSAGHFSPYGDEVWPLLWSLATHGDLYVDRFGEESFLHFENYEGRLNSVMVQFESNWKKGKRGIAAAANDDQAHALVKVPLITARYAGTGQLLERMEAAVRVHQNNDNAVKIAIAAALMLEKVILGSSIEEALQWAADPGYLHVDSHSRGLLQQALTMKQMQAPEVAKRLGSSCHLPGSFQVPMYILACQKSYEDAVRTNILAAGDQASRAHLIGAFFAAEGSESAIPTEWKAKLSMLTQLEVLIENLLQAVG